MEQNVPLLDDHGSPSPSLTRHDDLPTSRYVIPSRWDQIVHISKRTFLSPNRSDQIIHICKRTFISLLPTYIQPRSTASETRKELHPTAYLDALRGYAALIVWFYHTFPLPDFWIFQQQLLFFRIVYRAGPGMVAIFFVISGYVLSYRMLKHMHNRDAPKVLDSLASSVFRRWFRLNGSTGIATFTAMVFTWLRWYYPDNTSKKDTLSAQLSDWFVDWLRISNPFEYIDGWIYNGAFGSNYMYQLWTIPVEYRGSIVLFLFCAAACKLTTRGRQIFLWVAVGFLYYWRQANIALFLIGMYIADLSLLRHPERLGSRARSLPDPNGMSEKVSTSRFWHSVAFKFTCILLLCAGLFFINEPDGSHPENIPDAPYPWGYLLSLVSPWYGEALYCFYPSVGAPLIVFALDNYELLQKPFTWSFSQYLGELSFGIYAMHVLVKESYFKPILNEWRVRVLGEGFLGVLFIEFFATLVVLWMADYFTRADRVVVNIGKWLENKTFQKW